MRRTDLDALHPALREAVVWLQVRFQQESIPFRLFEAYRSSLRQDWLYSQGRSGGPPGPIVTKAKAWESYHQYGLAVDFVLWLEGRWSWSDTGIYKRYWTRLQDLGKEVGLEPLSWEKPHLQVAGLELKNLQKGLYPDGGDEPWMDNLEAAAISWQGSPGAPRLVSPRPAVR